MKEPGKLIIAVIIIMAILGVCIGITSPGDAGDTNERVINSSDLSYRRSSVESRPSNGVIITRLIGKSFAMRRSGDLRPAGDAAQWMDGHRRAAENGDADAIYELYLTLNECSRYLAASAPAELAWAKQLGASDEYEVTIERKLSECSAITEAERAEEARLLSKAASLGSIEAQISYASRPDIVLDEPINKESEEFLEWRSNAISYLNEAVMRGSVDALMDLSDAYRVGFMVPADPVEYYGLQLALHDVNPNYSIESPLNEARAKLSPEQLQVARRIGLETFRVVTQ